MRFLKNCIPLSAWIFLSANVLAADTIVLRNNVGQFICSIVHESTSSIIFDVHGVLLSVRRSDVVEIIPSNGQSTLNQPSAFTGFESASNPEPYEMPSETPNNTVIPLSDIPISIPTETPTDLPIPPIESNPITGLVEPAPLTIVQGSSDMPTLPVVLPKGKAYQITGAGVRFRNGPSLDYPIVTTLPSRTVLLELEITDGWLHAKTLEGIEGWIHLNFVQPMQNETVMVTGDNLHVREAAGDIYRSLARLRRGDIVVKLDETPGWWFLLTNDAVAGWSSAEYLKRIDNPALLTPPMRVVQNDAAGSPVQVERVTDLDGSQRITFTVLDDNIVVKGKTKLCVLRNDATEINYRSESIMQRNQIGSSSGMLSAGFPESLAVRYTTMDVLTLLGARTVGGWQYTLTIPSQEQLAFAFVLQEGPNRGIVVLIP